MYEMGGKPNCVSFRINCLGEKSWQAFENKDSYMYPFEPL
jgi:hypothetical protein